MAGVKENIKKIRFCGVGIGLGLLGVVITAPIYGFASTLLLPPGLSLIVSIIFPISVFLIVCSKVCAPENSLEEIKTSENNETTDTKMAGKSMLIAYVLWFLIGLLGAHRFYLMRVKSGFTFIFLYIAYCFSVYYNFLIFSRLLILILAGWWILDVYFTYTMVIEKNAKVEIEVPAVSLPKTDRS